MAMRLTVEVLCCQVVVADVEDRASLSAMAKSTRSAYWRSLHTKPKIYTASLLPLASIPAQKDPTANLRLLYIAKAGSTEQFSIISYFDAALYYF